MAESDVFVAETRAGWMKLEFAVLADAAVVTTDGKISILNGDLGAIYVRAFPALHTMLALVVKLNAEPAEAEHEHYFRAELLSPQGAPVVRPARSEIVWQRNREDEQDETRRAGFVASFPLLTFPVPGKYAFRLMVDEQEIGSIPLYLKQQVPDNEVGADESQGPASTNDTEVG